VTLQD
jgi:hypothetical protein